MLAIKKVMSSGQKPVLAILGGAKISSKIPILKNIIKIVESNNSEFAYPTSSIFVESLPKNSE